MAASLSSSIAQLDGGTRWAWSLLALFPALFDAAAAAALWGEGVARDAWEPLDASMALAGLRVLRSRCLLAYDPQTRRYDQHDLLRLMARRELGGGVDVESAQRRLVYHYVAAARAVDRDQRYLDLDPDWPTCRRRWSSPGRTWTCSPTWFWPSMGIGAFAVWPRRGRIGAGGP